jgi:ribosomal protein L33
LINAGLNAKENEEIEPGIFISFFLKILNSILNEITEIDEKSLSKDLYVLSTAYKFDKYNEEMNFNLYISTYSKRLLSLISRNFFNIMEIKQECKNPGCNYVGYSFSMLNFIPFNVNILENQCQKKDNLHLRDGFNCLLNHDITLNKDRGIYCNKCNDFTIHQESKKFYHTSKDLIIIFDRGEDFSNKTFINFDEQLVLSKAEVERYNEVRYNLVSILVKMETQKEREEFICFMPFGNGNWVSNKNKQNSLSLDEVKKTGIIVALFYYSEDNNLILQSNNRYNGNGFNNI